MTGQPAPLKQRIQTDMNAALKAGDKQRLGTLRLMLAAIRQREIDDRVELDEAEIVAVLDKMVKQRRESIAQYERANRQDLADVEKMEIQILHDYLPEPLTASVLASLIGAAITETGASGISDIGKVMAVLKPKTLGRADMTAVANRVRELLGR
jgi:uncharacterized protein YqeY